TSYSFSNGRSWLRYASKNRLAVDRSASGNPGGMETWEKSGDAQNSASAAATWTRRSGRSRAFTPLASSPPTWSMCMWVSTTSVTDARSMRAASSRWANRPVRGKSGYSTPIGVDEYGPAAATHHDHVQRPLEHVRRQEHVFQPGRPDGRVGVV